MTPDYPGKYGNWRLERDCTWTLVAPEGTRLMLNSFSYAMEAFYSDCNYDYLTIHDGPGTSYNQITKICGKGNQTDIVSTTNYIVLKFKSSYADYGFQIQYEIKGKFK